MILNMKKDQKCFFLSIIFSDKPLSEKSVFVCVNSKAISDNLLNHRHKV